MICTAATEDEEEEEEEEELELFNQRSYCGGGGGGGGGGEITKSTPATLNPSLEVRHHHSLSRQPGGREDCGGDRTVRRELVYPLPFFLSFFWRRARIPGGSTCAASSFEGEGRVAVPQSSVSPLGSANGYRRNLTAHMHPASKEMGGSRCRKAS